MVIQRFGGGLNLNVHLHALVLDDVFTRQTSGSVRFVPGRSLTALDIAEVLAIVVPRVRALLARRGIGDDASDVDAWGDAAPALAEAAAASVQGLVTGASGVTRPMRLAAEVRIQPGDDETAPLHGCHARADGFDLDADVRVGTGQRDRLERLCRYALRPPVSADRLTLTPQGRVRLMLGHPYRDGTTHLVFEPVAFLARLAVLVPRPWVNLLLYHGVLAPRAAWRGAIVQRRQDAIRDRDRGDADSRPEGTGSPSSAANYRWAELMRRTFGIDVLVCPRCGGRLRLMALIDQPAIIARILTHLGLPAEVPAPARGSPVRCGESSLF